MFVTIFQLAIEKPVSNLIFYLEYTHDDMPSFAVVVGIFIDNDRTIIFVVTEMTTVMFHKNFHAYEVNETLLN